MKIRYIAEYPQILPLGGGGVVLDKYKEFLNISNEYKPLEWDKKEIDFNVLFVFNFTYHSPELLSQLKQKGVKIVIIPIFDRSKNYFLMKSISFLKTFKLLNVFSLRKKILKTADIIIAHNLTEQKELIELYDANKSKIKVLHYGISEEILSSEKKENQSLFYNKYKIRNFIFCPAAVISKRKNQISLLRALEKTNYKLVLTGCDNIEPEIKTEFENLTQKNKNVLCLGRLDINMLTSCYKNAEVSISVSQSETAGLVNLEGALLGCKIVTSNLDSIREYMSDFSNYINQNSKQSILNGLKLSYNQDYNPDVKKYVITNFTWENYFKELLITIQ
jgi:glycosyltransferase involved in cell wall biosynthesis